MTTTAISNQALEIISKHGVAEIIHNSITGQKSLHAMVPFKEGDVVTRINGQSVKTPDDAIKVWQELRVASELRIDYERNGAPATLRYLITND